jgi:hypothetical protein
MEEYKERQEEEEQIYEYDEDGNVKNGIIINRLKFKN